MQRLTTNKESTRILQMPFFRKRKIISCNVSYKLSLSIRQQMGNLIVDLIHGPREQTVSRIDINLKREKYLSYADREVSPKTCNEVPITSSSPRS
jgi:hypothetical protein